ncbi:MAG: glycine oxidase ThiO [Gemmataceae bacterium]
MNEQRDVLIIGGGVIGLTCAYFLAREGLRVEVVDRGDMGQEASWAGAGILPPGNPERAATPYDQLRARSAVMFPSLSAELRERTGMDNGFWRCGGLELVSEADDDWTHCWRAEGIPFEKLSEDAAAHLEPRMTTGSHVVYHLPDMAQLRNPRHLKALLAGCGALGVRLRPGCPLGHIEVAGARVVAVHGDQGAMRAERFVIAAGAWTDSLLRPLGWRLGIRPIRGQIALLRTLTPVFRRIIMVGAHYLVPRPDGRVLVGSTEEDAGYEKRTTAQAIHDLLQLATSIVPTLQQAHLERCWAGLRPGSPDGLPFLGPVPGLDNLVVAAGHFRAGIQLSPATATVLKELILGQPLTVPLADFRLDRTPGDHYQPAFRA